AKNRNHIVNSYVIVPKGTQECKLDKIRNSIPGSLTNLHFCPIDRSLIGDGKIFMHVTTTVNSKLFIVELLPPDVHRVLYLDCDIIVRGDVEGLWNYDLYDSVVGAVEDPNMHYKEKLGLLPGQPYFNAGVLLVDLDRWRAGRVGPRALNFLHSHP